MHYYNRNGKREKSPGFGKNKTIELYKNNNNYKPPKQPLSLKMGEVKSGMSAGATAGIVIGVVFVLIGLGVGIWLYMKRNKAQAQAKVQVVTENNNTNTKKESQIPFSLSCKSLPEGIVKSGSSFTTSESFVNKNYYMI